jgi:hypothetical protein
MKNKITSEVARNYFTNTTTREDARAVEELLNNVIGGLIAEEEAADSIPAIEDICASLKDEHGIDLPESFAADYLYKYVETNCPHLFDGGNEVEEIKCFFCGKAHIATEHMLCELKTLIDELESSFKETGIKDNGKNSAEECFFCDVITGSIRGWNLAASLGELKRVESV